MTICPIVSLSLPPSLSPSLSPSLPQAMEEERKRRIEAGEDKHTVTDQQAAVLEEVARKV